MKGSGAVPTTSMSGSAEIVSDRILRTIAESSTMRTLILLRPSFIGRPQVQPYTQGAVIQLQIPARCMALQLNRGGIALWRRQVIWDVAAQMDEKSSADHIG